MKFIPNISTLFREEVFLNRFDEAKKNGFNAVEIQSPYDCSIESIIEMKEKSGVQIILINCCTADDFGCASIPGRDIDFMKSISNSMDYTFKLGVQKLHILAGVKDENFTEDEQFNCMVNNLQTASETLENYNVIGLIEPLSYETKPNYFMNSFEKAVKILNKVNKENIKLLLDIYHLKKIEGDVTPKILQKYFKYAGHIQISQDPGRREPFSKNGSINYADVFAFLKQQNYSGYIGLEYFASESTSESLKWLQDFHI